MIESEADRLMFLNTGDFGITAQVVSESSGNEAEISVIFDIPHLSVDLGNGAISTSEPQMTCRTSDLVGFGQGDTVTLNGANWSIVDVMDDGTGMSVVKLHRKP